MEWGILRLVLCMKSISCWLLIIPCVKVSLGLFCNCWKRFPSSWQFLSYNKFKLRLRWGITHKLRWSTVRRGSFINSRSLARSWIGCRRIQDPGKGSNRIHMQDINRLVRLKTFSRIRLLTIKFRILKRCNSLYKARLTRSILTRCPMMRTRPMQNRQHYHYVCWK